MAEIHWTPTALRDLSVICEFIARDSPLNAERIGLKAFDAAERLSFDARVGWMVPDFERDDVRELFVRPYRIVYRIKNEECYILSVLHSSRDIRSVIDPDEFD